MRSLLFLFAILLFSSLSAQITWADDIAELAFTNCTPCHHDNGIGPFSLMEYDLAAANGQSIVEQVAFGKMPPWTADTTYQEYVHERVLSQTEIDKILTWANDGFLEGNPENTPPPPVYSDEGFLSEEPDLELIMEPHTSNATPFFDDYICVTIPTGLTQDKKVRAFEVIPGNSAIVHHCLVYVDPDATYQDNLSGFCGGPTEGLIGGYTPGSRPTIFPSNGDDFNLGVTLSAGSNIVFAMHYPAGSAGQEDATKIRFYFYDDDVPIRNVFSSPIIQNWNFMIPANETVEVSAEFESGPIDFSVLTVFPHMHLIGEEIECFAITPENDTIPFVHIPHWDFEWQEFLFFKNILRIPAGSTLYGRAVYENTAEHEHNPNDPPEDIYAGLNTSDEMFLIYFHFLPYFEGDELWNIEELTTLPVNLLELDPQSSLGVSVFPNPSSDSFQFEFELENTEQVSLWIYDQQGRVVEKVIDRKALSSSMSTITWKPEDLSSGVYFYSARIGESVATGRLVWE